MGVIAHEPHNTRVIVVVRCYLLYPISTCSAEVAGGIPVWMYVLVVLQMAITTTACHQDKVLSELHQVII